MCCNFFLLGLYNNPGSATVNGGRLIRLVRRGMRTGQALFLLGIEPDIPRVRPWKELLATGFCRFCRSNLMYIVNQREEASK